MISLFFLLVNSKIAARSKTFFVWIWQGLAYEWKLYMDPGYGEGNWLVDLPYDQFISCTFQPLQEKTLAIICWFISLQCSRDTENKYWLAVLTLVDLFSHMRGYLLFFPRCRLHQLIFFKMNQEMILSNLFIFYCQEFKDRPFQNKSLKKCIAIVSCKKYGRK